MTVCNLHYRWNGPIECMACINRNANVEIMLADGLCVYSCDMPDCIVFVIKENASTDNPVHSIEVIEEMES